MIATSSLPRSGGVLLHPTSLPGTAIGDIGPSARRFVDIVGEMGLRWWQVLPMGPTGHGDSPYQSPSTFAGNPLLISEADLAADGLVDGIGDDDEPGGPIDFGAAIPWKTGILEAAVDGFRRQGGPDTPEYRDWVDRTDWLDDFALFTALKRAHASSPWWTWDPDIAGRVPGAVRAAESGLAEPIEDIRIEQYLFDRQFTTLRDVCRGRGVGLIGDVPIFVAHDSADVWANRRLFLLEPDGSPTFVAGVPPDYFSVTGQRWGNPLYDWPQHEATGFEWWIRRMRRHAELFDLVRIDHFRGFAASWHIPASEATAVTGEWVDAPGRELFTRLRDEVGDLGIIAEDLGVITPDVEALRDEFGLPGMKVLQFGFGTESAHALSEFRPHVVAYTGTHDNDTAMGWFRSTDPRRRSERERALAELGSDGSEFSWDLTSAVFESPAAIAVTPLQDLLGLGTEARMNTPGTTAGNWRWRFEWEDLTPGIVARVAALVERTGR